jgi:cell division protein FtsW (lipid II flippase)
MSYGGSHLIGECIGLGIILSMVKYERAIHPDDINNEFLGFT